MNPVLKFIFLCSILIITPAIGSDVSTENTDNGRFSEQRVSEIINGAKNFNTNNKKIDFISEQFIGVPYRENVLVGDNKTEEVLTINLEALDCFTYIDYVEAIRLSSVYKDFRDNVIKVRYKDGVISYPSRNHFFSDWTIADPGSVEDITAGIGRGKTRTELKYLNMKEDGTLYLPDLPVVTRKISYIPSDSVDKSVTDGLQTGDYIGIYSTKKGLDVSHTGIIIRKEGKLYLRHASSRTENRRVVDENLTDYIKNKPGIVVYRPL